MNQNIPIFSLNIPVFLFLLLILFILAVVLRKRKNLIAAIVAAGIIILIIFGAMVLINMSGIAQTGLKQAAKDMSLVLKREVSKIESSKNISEKDISVIKELADFATARETSTWGIYIDAIVVRNAIKNGEVNEQERNNMILVRDLLREKQGKLSANALNSFTSKYPAIKEIIEKETEDKETWKRPLSDIEKWLMENDFPVYPSSYDIEKKPGKPINYKRVAYRVNIDYRSKGVFEFYNNLLKEMGWHDYFLKNNISERKWANYTNDRSEEFCSFSAHWIDPAKKYIINFRLRYNLSNSTQEYPDEQEVICSVVPSSSYSAPSRQ